MDWLIQHFDHKAIAVQTFLIIWRLKDIPRGVSAWIISAQLVFLILSFFVGFGINHPPHKYYAAPAPVWHTSGCQFSLSLRRACDSIGAGLAMGRCENALAYGLSGSGWH